MLSVLMCAGACVCMCVCVCVCVCVWNSLYGQDFVLDKYLNNYLLFTVASSCIHPIVPW